jgi:hypothetical protein
LFVQIAAPPMNLLGPELIRDQISLIQQAEADATFKVLVFRSADADYSFPMSTSRESASIAHGVSRRSTRVGAMAGMSASAVGRSTILRATRGDKEGVIGWEDGAAEFRLGTHRSEKRTRTEAGGMRETARVLWLSATT